MTETTRISRRELAAVAVALLLPIPLLAASGLRFPLPGAVERGAASLVAGGGGFDVPVVEAAGSATSPASQPTSASSAEAEGTASADESFAVSSTAAPSGGTGAASVREESPGERTADTDSPTPPNPHTDDTTPPAEGDGDGDGDAPEPIPEEIAAAPVEGVSAEAGVAIEAETQVASVEVAVTDSDVTVDTGGAADLGAPLVVPLPVSLPGLPLP